MYRLTFWLTCSLVLVTLTSVGLTQDAPSTKEQPNPSTSPDDLDDPFNVQPTPKTRNAVPRNGDAINKADDDFDPLGEKVEQVQLQLQIVELRGEDRQALKEIGLVNSNADGKSSIVSSRLPLKGEAELKALLLELNQKLQVDVLSKPVVRTGINQEMRLEVGIIIPKWQYLEKTGPTNFELREFKTDAKLGLQVTFTPRHGDKPNQTVLSHLKFSVTSFDGREAVPGVDLDIGKPIISTRSLETSVTLPEVGETIAVVLAGPPERQPLMFITVLSPNSDILPSPPVGQVISKPAEPTPANSTPDARRVLPNPTPIPQKSATPIRKPTSR